MTVSFIVIDDATREILRGGTCADHLVDAQAQDGQSAYQVEPGVLSWPTINVEPQRPIVWERVKAKRDAVINGGSPTPEGMVDSDELSRSNISGAVLAALIAKTAGAPFAMDWTMLDNSVATLAADDVISLGLAVLQHVNLAHDRARQLRAEIESAATIVDLLSIDLTTGWPT